MHKLRGSSSLASIFVLGGGNVIGTIISALALILFSRFMGPVEFGLFSAAFAAMQIVVRISDLGTNMATERQVARVHAQNPELSDRLLRSALYFKGIAFLILLSLGWVLAPWLAGKLNIPSVALVRSAFLLSAGTIFFEFSTLVFQSTARFALVARITIAQAIGKLLFGAIFIWQGLLQSTQALLIYGLLPGIGALLGWKRNTLSSLKLPKTWALDLKTILSVAKWTGIAALAATAADNIDTLLVQSFMSSYDTGIWSGAVRIATFAGVIGWSVGSVLNVRVARYHDRAHLNEYLKKSWKISLAILFGLVLTIPLARFAIELTIGSAYLEGTTSLQVLILAAGLSGAAAPYVALFYLFDKPEYYAITGIMQTLILVAGDLIFIPTHGLIGAAWVRVIVRLTVLVFTLIYARRAYAWHYRQHGR